MRDVRASEKRLGPSLPAMLATLPLREKAGSSLGQAVSEERALSPTAPRPSSVESPWNIYLA